MLTTIKMNTTGNLVKVAKYLTGYSERNAATDTFDYDFSLFVKEWQSANGLTADGIIGPLTWGKIAGKAYTCSTSKNRTSAGTCAIQILIGGLTVDGIFGTLTKKAVATYQAANNLQADGICGPKTWGMLISGTATADVKTSTTTVQPTISAPTTTNGKTINTCVHYLQWDSKWKNVKFSTHTSSQTIGNSGCGPSSMAQIMATWIDPAITPVEMCALAVEAGYRTYNSGTAWGFFEFVFKKYPQFAKFSKTTSVETLKSALAQGALAVCSMNSGDNHFWTSGGHYITAIGFDSDGYIYANDPNKKECPRKQKQDRFQTCMKQAFIFWPTIKVEEPEPNNDSASTSKRSSSAIVDISKHQGSIDFDKLDPNVTFVIARASCGSDKDSMIDTYAAAMNERHIPFGVYCYSYAGTNEKAIDEAQKIVEYAGKYNPMFYIMDAEETRITNDTIAAFAKALRDQGVKRIGCYVAHNHYKDYDYDSLRDLFDFTWIPRYGKNDGTIDGSTKPAYKCDLWQYTSAGKIAGINGNADLNVITGDGRSLDWFLGGE